MSDIEVITYTIRTKVVHVERRVRKEHISGVGADAKMRAVFLGWFVTFQGSFECLTLVRKNPRSNPVMESLSHLER